MGHSGTVIHYRIMVGINAGCFTVGVFQDVKWAQTGIDALKRQGLLPESLSIIAKDGPDVAALIERTLGSAADRLEMAAAGAVLAKGPLVAALDGAGRDLGKLGLAGTMRRVGFQAHDARIYEALTARGGVLVAVHSEPRAADALTVLLSYGGGNAAIGAWTGLV
jgi:hypothetical protein